MVLFSIFFSFEYHKSIPKLFEALFLHGVLGDGFQETCDGNKLKNATYEQKTFSFEKETCFWKQFIIPMFQKLL